MIIIFTVAANTGVSAVTALYLATICTVDDCARLRLDKIQNRSHRISRRNRLWRSITRVSSSCFCQS